MTTEREQTGRILGTLRALEADLEQRSRELAERSRAATLLLRVLAVVMAALSLANIYYVNDLTQEVRLVIANMQEMSRHLDQVTARMRQVRSTTQAMEQDVRTMPIVALQTREVATHMDRMREATAGMTVSTVSIDGRMDVMDRHVLDMSLWMRGLNQGVGMMGVDVNQMSRPFP